MLTSKQQVWLQDNTMNDLYRMLEKFRDNACLQWQMLPYTHSNMLATGWYLAS